MSSAEDIQFTVPEFDPDLIDQYRREFRGIDADQNGFLDKEEFSNYLLKKGYSEKTIRNTFNIVDVNHDEKIVFKEFANFIQSTKEIVENNDVNRYLKMVFNSCDKNKDGILDKSEFVKFMKYMDVPVGFFERDKKFKEVDSDKSGTIEFNEILRYYHFIMKNSHKKGKK